jgi:deoxyribonuclease IV
VARAPAILRQQGVDGAITRVGRRLGNLLGMPAPAPTRLSPTVPAPTAPSPSAPSPSPGSPASRLRNPVGTHVPVGKNLVDGALRTADEIGAETIQVFVGNPRGWRPSPGKPAEDRRFRDAIGERGMRVFVHAPYLVNLGSPTPATYEQSVAILAHNLRRAAEIGAEGVVVHTGSFVDPGLHADRYGAAMRQVREGLLPLLDAVADDEAPWLLLEPTAGQGRSLCAGVEDLEPYLAALDFHPKAGICLDTCHVFAAGAPLDEPGGAAATVERIAEIGGAERLRLVHANDSMDVRGAFRDRHEQIGLGHIGAESFRELLAHPLTDGVPFILETPDSGKAGGPDLPLLKQLRSAVAKAA